MKKLDLRQNEATVFRVLDFNDDRVLVINCTHSSMPAWVEKEKIEQYERTEETALPALPDFEMLSPEQKRIARERFAIIAGILPFVGEQSSKNEKRFSKRECLSANSGKQINKCKLHQTGRFSIMVL